jgi:hypothetical protein
MDLDGAKHDAVLLICQDINEDDVQNTKFPMALISGEGEDAPASINYPAAAAELQALQELGKKAGHLIGEKLGPRFCAVAVANAKSYIDAVGEATEAITDCFEEHSEEDLENPELAENGFIMQDSGRAVSIRIPGVGFMPGARNIPQEEAHEVFTQHLYDAMSTEINSACRKAWSDKSSGVRSIFPLVKKPLNSDR